MVSSGQEQIRLCDLPGKSCFLVDFPDMKRIGLYSWYHAGTVLGEFSAIKAGEYLAPSWNTIFETVHDLKILRDSPSIQLPQSNKAARELLEFAEKLTELYPYPFDEPKDEKLSLEQFMQKAQLVNKFETVLESELAEQFIYYMSPVLGYSTEALASNALALFPEDVQPKLPDRAKRDFQEAGRCLAFDVPTAFAFHVFRAVEAVMLDYRTLVVGSAPKPNERNWGAYIRDLRSHGGNTLIIGYIEQIKDRYRNPITHPEAFLELRQAQELMGVCVNVICLMVEEIEAIKGKQA